MTFMNKLTPALGDEAGRRLVTGLLVLLTAVSALAWAWAVRRQLSTGAPVAAAVPAAVVPEPALPAAAELARLLGATGAAAPEPTPAQRFQVLGVIAGVSGRGAALIAVDGQPPRPFAVGAEVAPGFVLKRLSAREVQLAETAGGPVRLTLPLPEWAPRSGAPSPEGAGGTSPPGAQNGPLPPSESTSALPGRRGEPPGP